MIVTIGAPTFDPCDSYGRLANELAAGLVTHGWTVNRIGASAPPQTVRPCLGGILLGYPTLHHTYGAMANTGPRVAVTMFESTTLPDGWTARLNRCDAVVVPGQWLVSVFRESGVRVPVEVIPLGVSDAFLHPLPRPAPPPLVFLAIADRGRRKGWHTVVQAFHRAFGEDMRYRLILKAREFPLRFSHPNVSVVCGDYDDAQLAELYGRAHVMVFPSSGEGFGLPPREFAATGGVAMATDWGGTADGLLHWGVSVAPSGTVDAWADRPDWHGKLGQWAAVDVAALAERMQFVARYYPYFQARAETTAAHFVRRNYRWEDFSRRVGNLWQYLLETNYANPNGRRDQPVTAAAGLD